MRRTKTAKAPQAKGREQPIEGPAAKADARGSESVGDLIRQVDGLIEDKKAELQRVLEHEKKHPRPKRSPAEAEANMRYLLELDARGEDPPLEGSDLIRDELYRLGASRDELQAKAIIGESIKNLRGLSGFTLDELAKHADVGRTTVVRYEKGFVAKYSEATKMLGAIERKLRAGGASAKTLDLVREAQLVTSATKRMHAATDPEEAQSVPPIKLDPEIQELSELAAQLDGAARQELLQFVRGFVAGRRPGPKSV